MPVLTGYILIYSYILILSFGLGTLIQKISNGETSRKCIHILLFLVWILIDRFFRGTIHQILIPTSFIFLNILSYRFKICKTIERTDGNHFGTVYFALAITAILTVSYFFPDFYLPSGVAVMCLTFGDGFAALMGYNFPSRKIAEHKSLLGFVSAAAAACLALLAFNGLYRVGLTWEQILILGLFTAILELVDYGLDNFTIVAGTFLLSWAFLFAPRERLTISAGLAVLVFLVIFFSHAIDYYGSLCSMAVVFCFSCFGGPFALGFLLASYFTVFFISAGKKYLLHRKKEERPRKARQILINGGLGTLCILAYGLTGRQRLLVIGIVSVGGCFVDSLSSDLGVLSSRPPYDPLRRCRVAAGLSGGMSVLGTLAALAGAGAIALAMQLHLTMAIPQTFTAFALMFGQTLVDTLLGSRFQIKYRCPVCGALTEKRQHCGKPSVPDSGLAWMDNNMVNLLSSILITALAFLLL